MSFLWIKCLLAYRSINTPLFGLWNYPLKRSYLGYFLEIHWYLTDRSIGIFQLMWTTIISQVSLSYVLLWHVLEENWIWLFNVEESLAVTIETEKMQIIKLAKILWRIIQKYIFYIENCNFYLRSGSF